MPNDDQHRKKNEKLVKALEESMARTISSGIYSYPENETTLREREEDRWGDEIVM